MPKFIYDIIPPGIKEGVAVATQKFSKWIKFLRIFLKTSKYGSLLLVIVIIGFGALLVFAFYPKTEVVEIFPTQYRLEAWSEETDSESQEHWQNGEKAFLRSLEEEADLAEFSSENSAILFARFAEEEVRVIVEDLVVSASFPVSEEVATESESFVAEAMEGREEIIEEVEAIATESEEMMSDELATESESEIEEVSSEVISDETASESEVEMQEEIPEGVGGCEFCDEEELASDAEDLLNLLEEVEEVTSISQPPLIKKSIIFSGFDFDTSISSSPFKNAKLNFSFAAGAGGEKDALLVEYRINKEDWGILKLIKLDNEQSNFINNDYWQKEVSDIAFWEDLSNIEVRFTFQGIDSENRLPVYLDAVWLSIEYSKPEREEERKEKKENLEDEYELELLSDKLDFKIDEDLEFKFHFRKKQKKNILGLIFAGKNRDTDIKIEFLGRDAELLNKINPQIQHQEDGKFTVSLNKLNLYKLQPGKYKIRIRIENTEGIFIGEQEFTWGVLAININKSIYLPGERAYLQMAALKDDGHTICNANLKLEITSPDGNLINPKVQQSGECRGNNVTDVPDYFAYYQVGGVGVYEMKLTNLDNGYEITDSFEVRESVLFDVERIGPTRIYPPATYEMKLRIKANQNFKGQVIESIPESFEILDSIIWNVDWKAGETYELEYQFDAPDISPYLYLLGPLKIGNFKEIRQWQIASDLSEGANYPGTITEVSTDDPWDDQAWTNPSEAATDNDTYANVGTLDLDKEYTYQLQATNFGFTIADGNTITGIMVEWEGYNPDSGVTHDLVQLIDETGTRVGEDKGTGQTLPTSVTIVSFGEDGDTWTVPGGLSPADIRDVDFGVAWAALSTSNNVQCYVDFIRMTVYYTEPAFTDISGTCKKYDESTACDTCTGCVKVAVNGGPPESQTGNIVGGGTWEIIGISQPSDTDILTVFLDELANASESVAVMEYDGSGNITGVELFEKHLTIANGGNTNFNISNADLNQYDSDSDEDVFHSSDGTNLEICYDHTLDCDDAELYIVDGMTYEPNGNVNTHDIEIEGIYTIENNVASVSGGWENGGTFTEGGSTIFLTASESAETVSGSLNFNNLKFGDDTGTAEWDLQNALDVNNNLTIDAGTLDVNTSNYAINIGVNFTTGTNASLSARSGTITLDETTSTTFTDSTTNKIEPYNLTINKPSATDSNDNLALSSNLTVRNTITLTDGQIIQGNYNVRAEGSAAVSIASGIDKEWTNIGTGDLTLGGTFDNAGSVSFDTNDNDCASDISDDIQILSTSAGIQRNWTGAGTFSMYNIYVQDMTSAPPIIVRAGSYSNVGDNWSFQSCNDPPTINEVSLNSKVTPIILIENTQIDIIVSASVTDTDGCGDISGVKAIVYRYDLYTDASCSLNYNNCYDEDQFECVADGACVSNTQPYNCYASSSMWYFADPTTANASSSYADDQWVVSVIASDSVWQDTVSHSWGDNDDVVDIEVLTALDVSGSITFGEVIVGNDTGSSPDEIGIKNTGNWGIDTKISGTTKPTYNIVNEIDYPNQKYASKSIDYSDGYNKTLDSTAFSFNVTIPKPTNNNAGANDVQIFWGIGIPIGTPVGIYEGTNTFSATSDGTD